MNQKSNHAQDTGRLEFASFPADKLLQVDVHRLPTSSAT